MTRWRSCAGIRRITCGHRLGVGGPRPADPGATRRVGPGRILLSVWDRTGAGCIPARAGLVLFVSFDRRCSSVLTAPEGHVGGVLARSDRGRRAWRPGRARVPGFDKGTIAGTLTGQCGQARSLPGGGEPRGPRPLSNPSGGSSGTVVTGCGQNSRTRTLPDLGRGRYSRTMRSHPAHKTTGP
jgi:hypothetical protein